MVRVATATNPNSWYRFSLLDVCPIIVTRYLKRSNVREEGCVLLQWKKKCSSSWGWEGVVANSWDHSALSAVRKHIMHNKRHWSAKHQGPTWVTHFPQQGCNPKDFTAFLHRITNLGPSAQTSVCRRHYTFKQHLVSSFQKVLLTNNDQEERS